MELVNRVATNNIILINLLKRKATVWAVGPQQREARGRVGTASGESTYCVLLHGLSGTTAIALLDQLRLTSC